MRIVDLFSGAGGLTFGFYYKIKGNTFVRNRRNTFVFANERDAHASAAFSKNFPDILMLNRDIKELSEDCIKELIGDQPVDLIIGGPPCQPFSTVGQRIYNDEALLYKEYLRILKIVRPKMFLFENVKGLLSMRETFYKTNEEGQIEYELITNHETGRQRKRRIVERYGRKLIDIIKDTYGNINEEFGYTIHVDVLNAVDFGVPENRERLFIVGTRKDLNLNWEYPKPTTEKKLSVLEAISDLPVVNEGENINEYDAEPQNAYQRLMRNKSDTLSFHCCGIYGKKIRTVIHNVGQGQGKNDFNRLVAAGKVPAEYVLKSGFANSYGRLIETEPCPTITNNLSTPSGLRCIHYNQHRALTPREGARIQSFPDWFVFDGFKADVTAQIGNAVPPILAMALAKRISSVLKG